MFGHSVNLNVSGSSMLSSRGSLAPLVALRKSEPGGKFSSDYAPHDSRPH